MSGRPFLGHADLPTPSAPSRPAFVPALRLGGPAPQPTRSSNASMAPARVAPSVVSVAKPASAFGGGGGAAGGGSRMAFKPAGGGHDASNVYIYRAPTNMYRPNASPSPPSASPSPPAAGGSGPASGITRGPPSATDTRMIGGPGRDYQFPSKADYTPFGPRNAPYAQQAAGARPITNGFRTPASVPHLRTLVRVPKRRPKAHPVKKAKESSGEGAEGDAADDEADGDDADGEVWDPDAPDDESESLAPSSRPGKKTARPSSAFRGASPRAPPPEAFEPDYAGLGTVMKVTSRRTRDKALGLPGAGRSKTSSKASSKVGSKAPSVAGSARSTKDKPKEHDPDDPFAEDAADGSGEAAPEDDQDQQLEQGDANAAAQDSPRSHRSHVSHVSARSHISAASKAASVHSAGWYTRQFHLTGDLATDMVTLQEKARALQAQVEAQKKAQQQGGKQEEEKEACPAGEEEEGEVFAQDGDEAGGGGDDENQEEQNPDESPEDEDAQPEQDGDQDAEELIALQEAEAEAEAEAENEAREEESAVMDEEHLDPSDSQEPVQSGEEDVSNESFQPDDLGSEEEEHKVVDRVAIANPSASKPKRSVEVDPTRKVLRPSNAWAQREPLISPPHLYTSSQWGSQTRDDMARLRAQGANKNGNETSDIDTEVDTEAEQSAKEEDEEQQQPKSDEEDSDSDPDEVPAAVKPAAAKKPIAAPADSDTDPFASSGDERGDPAGAEADADAGADLSSTALFVVHAPSHGTSTLRRAGAPSSNPLSPSNLSPMGSTMGVTMAQTAAFSAHTANPDDSEDESGIPTSVLAQSGSVKNLFANIMQQVNAKSAAASIPKPPTPKRVKKAPSVLGGGENESKSETGSAASSTAGKSTTGSISSSKSAPVPAAAATSSSTIPAPVVDYMAVLKKKGVAPVLESDRAKIAEANSAMQEIKKHEMTLAQLRAREKELMQLKWQQVQAAEQSSARSNASDPFKSPPMSPAAQSNRSGKSVTASPASPSSSSSSALPSSHPSLSASHSQESLVKMRALGKLAHVIKPRNAIAPPSPAHRVEDEAKEEESIAPPQPEPELAEIPVSEAEESFVSDSGAMDASSASLAQQHADAPDESFNEIPSSERDPFASDNDEPTGQGARSPSPKDSDMAQEQHEEESAAMLDESNVQDSPAEEEEEEQSQGELDLSASIDGLAIQPQPKKKSAAATAPVQEDDDDPFA